MSNNIREKFFKKAGEVKRKEVELDDIGTVVVESPDIQDMIYLVGKLEGDVKQDDPKAIERMAKLVINRTFTEDGKPLFNKGDLEYLKKDRSGNVLLLYAEIVSLLNMTAEELEKAKKN